MEELKSSTEVLEWLARSENLSWIGESSVHLRAFYLGLYSGLGLGDADRVARERVLVRMFVDTMSSKPADDPFRLSELSVRIETLRHHLYREVEAADRRAMDNSGSGQPDREIPSPSAATFTPVLECVEELDQQWTRHLGPGLDRTALEPPHDTLKALESLEDSFRHLAVGKRD